MITCEGSSVNFVKVQLRQYRSTSFLKLAGRINLIVNLWRFMIKLINFQSRAPGTLLTRVSEHWPPQGPVWRQEVRGEGEAGGEVGGGGEEGGGKRVSQSSN